MHVLLVNSTEPVRGRAQEIIICLGGACQTLEYGEALLAAHREPVDAMIVQAPDPLSTGRRTRDEFDALLRTAEAEHIPALVVEEQQGSINGSPRALLDSIRPDIPAAELRGRLLTIGRYQEMLRRMEGDLSTMERLGKRLNQHFFEIDQEMRLAARLQCDFLPNLARPVGGVPFATLYRPARWVSGDIYDVVRVDETHVAFYVADAVGHGLSAGLLTMFIKKAIVPKHIDGDRYEVLEPEYVLRTLNDALAEQSLPNCQFITAWYGLVDTATWTLRYARGGHPYPLLLGRGEVTELKSSGGLLGLKSGDTFPNASVRLQPGDKIVAFSDGIENVFQSPDRDGLEPGAYRRVFADLCDVSVDELITRLQRRLDGESGSIMPRDDITVVAMEVPS
jgi:serine phosphatase RsbU (regulator of sigma subunit)